MEGKEMSEQDVRMAFTFYRSFQDAIRKLERVEDREALYNAIIEYSLDEIEPQFSYNMILELAWTLIKPNLDSSITKSKNGKKAKGVSKKNMIGNQNARKKPNQTENRGKTKLNQNYIDIDKDIDIDIDIDKDIEELEISDRHFVHSLDIKDNYSLFSIVCKVVGMGFAKGSYRKNKANFLNKCGNILSYMERYGVSIDEWSEFAFECNELSDVCTDKFFKRIANNNL